MTASACGIRGCTFASLCKMCGERFIAFQVDGTIPRARANCALRQASERMRLSASPISIAPIVNF
jgi:hypothetical protein